MPASLEPVEAAKATFEQIDTVKRIVAAYPTTFEIATTADDISHPQGGPHRKPDRYGRRLFD
ncbi:membrane dipeptidase [Brevundimonas vesicularis]